MKFWMKEMSSVSAKNRWLTKSRRSPSWSSNLIGKPRQSPRALGAPRRVSSLSHLDIKVRQLLHLVLRPRGDARLDHGQGGLPPLTAGLARQHGAQEVARRRRLLPAPHEVGRRRRLVPPPPEQGHVIVVAGLPVVHGVHPVRARGAVHKEDHGRADVAGVHGATVAPPIAQLPWLEPRLHGEADVPLRRCGPPPLASAKESSL